MDEAMGASGIHMDMPDELREALARAWTADWVTVIAVLTDPETRFPGFGSWWDVQVAGASGQASVRAVGTACDRKRRERRIDIQ
jgi:TPP-dependent trihydroxycyclohexane-1,2-dione (THcHDO) dehydratase